MALNVNRDDLDNRLISGDLDVGVEGSEIGRPVQGRILADATLRANVDSAPAALLWYTALSASVPPLDNVDCRKAVLLAAGPGPATSARTAETAGEIATNLLPPVIAGAQRFDLYPTPGNAGDPDQARAALVRCGRPEGFATTISYRAERPDEGPWPRRSAVTGPSRHQTGAAAFPAGGYFKLYAGNPAFVKANNLGLIVAGREPTGPTDSASSPRSSTAG